MSLNNNRLALLCLVASTFLLLPASMSAQLSGGEYPAFAIPPSLLENANQVVRMEQISFRIKDTREGTLVHKKVVTVLNDRNKEDELVLYYDADTRVKDIQASIYDAYGKLLRKVSAKEIKDYAATDGFSIYNDSRVKLLAVTHSSYPYTISYSYEMTLKGLHYAVFPNWNIQEYHTAVQKSQFEIEMPADMALHYKALNAGVAPVTEALGGGRKKMTWQVEGLPAVAYEPYSPSAASVLPRLLTSPDRFEFDSYSGSMATWKDYGAFMYQLWQGRDALPDGVAKEVRAIAAANGDNNAAKIAAIYRYVQANMRYVSVQMGIGGWQPFDAAYVAQNKYGDCKALTNFTKAALKEAGIEAWPALIKNGKIDYDLTEDFATSRFNHVILFLPESNTWLECTSADDPPNYIGASNADRSVLLITPQGGQLARTPPMDHQSNQSNRHTRVALRADGSATLSHQAANEGESHEVIRYLANHISQSEREEWLTKSITLPAFTLGSLQVSAARDNPKSQLGYEATLGQVGSRTGKRWFVPINPVSAFTDVPPAVSQRKQAIHYKQAYTENDTISISLPEGYDLESYPQAPLLASSAFGDYSLSTERHGDTLTIRRQLVMRPAVAEAADYAAFRTFMRDVAKYDGVKIVLVQR